MKIRDPFPNKTKDKLKKANRVRFSFSGLWSPYLIFLGQTIIFTLSLVTKILVGYKSYLQKCLFLISRVIWWARWGGRGRGGRGWVCEGGGGHCRIRLPKIYWSSLGFVWIWILIRQCLYTHATWILLFLETIRIYVFAMYFTIRLLLEPSRSCQKYSFVPLTRSFKR